MGSPAGLEMLDPGDLRIDHQADRSGESRALGRFRQAFDAERPAYADLAGDDPPRQLRQAGELASAASQDQPPRGMGPKARILQTIADKFEDLFDARPDDAHELGFRQHAGVVQSSPTRATVIVSRSSEGE